MQAQRKMDGLVEALTGLSGVGAAVCFGCLGYWWSLPFGAWALVRVGNGVYQAVTGERV